MKKCIQNFDVDYEEEAPAVRMIGGIRGIRALRVQRDYLKEFCHWKWQVANGSC